jgi:hypothetical protein
MKNSRLLLELQFVRSRGVWCPLVKSTTTLLNHREVLLKGGAKRVALLRHGVPRGVGHERSF